MRFQYRCFAECKDLVRGPHVAAHIVQRKITAAFPYRGKRGGEATEDRVSIRPDLDHFGSDVDLVG